MRYWQILPRILFFYAYSAAATADLKLLPVSIHVDDKPSLQRGAKLYMNYCSGCHALKYMQYMRMGIDLGLTRFDGSLDQDLLTNNLIFTRASVHAPIDVSMPAEDARQWFGIVPPDLSLIVKVRGADWLYTYLKSFYDDASRPFGSNNLLKPNLAMPNVLASFNSQELDPMLVDLLTFLAYVAEPNKGERIYMGLFVLGFLLVLLGFVWQLKKAYWQKIS